MKYFQLILILRLSFALTIIDQSKILDPNDLMFTYQDFSTYTNMNQQQIAIQDQQQGTQQFNQDSNMNEVLTEAELQHVLIKKDDVSDKPDIEMGLQEALCLQKRKY